MKKLFLFLSLSVALCTFSQSGKIFTEINYNTFSHSNLSDFQQELVSELESDIGVRLTTKDFSGNVGFSLGYEIVDQDMALFFSYNKADIESFYSDVSGRVGIQQVLNGYTLGGMYLIDINNVDLKLGLRGFFMYTTLDVETYFEATGFTSFNDSLGFSAAEIGVL